MTSTFDSASFWCGPRPLHQSLRAGPGRGFRFLAVTLGVGVPQTCSLHCSGAPWGNCLSTLPLDNKGGLPQDTMALATGTPFWGAASSLGLSWGCNQLVPQIWEE